MSEADVGGLIVTFFLIVAAIAGVVGLLVLTSIRLCPHCNEPLHEVKVLPLDGSMPPGSRWYCSHCQPTRYFAELPGPKSVEREL